MHGPSPSRAEDSHRALLPFRSPLPPLPARRNPYLGPRSGWSLLPCLGLALALAGCDAGGDRDDRAGSTPSAAEAEKREATRLVRVAPVSRGPISYEIETSGDVEAEFWADLHPRSTGFVRTLAVDEGSVVEAGAVLAALDDDDARLRVDAAALAVREMEREIDRQQATISELERRLDQRKLLEAREEEEYRRAVDIPQGVLSEEEVAQKRYEYEDARVARLAAELALEQARAAAKVNEVRAAVARVELDRAELELAHTRIRAPIPGVIARREIRVGERVGPETRAFQLVDTSRLVCDVFVPQKEIRFLREGLEARIRCDAVPGSVFGGSVRTVSPVVEGGNVKVRMDVDNPDRLLLPGMFLSIRLILDVHEGALLVPKKGILHDRDRPFVFVVRDGRAERVLLRPGYEDRESIEAIPAPGGDEAPKTATLEAGSLVVVRGQENLRDGSRVEIEGSEQSRGSAPGAKAAEADARP